MFWEWQTIVGNGENAGYQIKVQILSQIYFVVCKVFHFLLV